jgi:GNAT superfamily N-acetyltransferase
MAQTHIYHWRHGWIPLDQAARMRKGSPEPKTTSDLQQHLRDRGLDVVLSGGKDADNPLIVHKIVVPKTDRSSGKGTEAMKTITDYADRHGLTVALTPDSAFGGSKTRLVQFYKRFGFVPNKGRNRDFSHTEDMTRPPAG